MRWTHKVVYRPDGRWWMVMLNDGVLTCSMFNTKLFGSSYNTKKYRIEDIYNYPHIYEVIRVSKFKGNL